MFENITKVNLPDFIKKLINGNYPKIINLIILMKIQMNIFLINLYILVLMIFWVYASIWKNVKKKYLRIILC